MLKLIILFRGTFLQFIFPTTAFASRVIILSPSWYKQKQTQQFKTDQHHNIHEFICLKVPICSEKVGEYKGATIESLFFKIAPC